MQTKRIRNIHALASDAARMFRITVEDLMGTRRVQHFSLARQVVFYVARKELGVSLPVIAERFGRDHTTILHGIRKIEKLIRQDKELARNVEVLTRMFNDPAPVAALAKGEEPDPIRKPRPKRPRTEDEWFEMADEAHEYMMRTGSRSLLRAINESLAA